MHILIYFCYATFKIILIILFHYILLYINKFKEIVYALILIAKSVNQILHILFSKTNNIQ